MAGDLADELLAAVLGPGHHLHTAHSQVSRQRRLGRGGGQGDPCHLWLLMCVGVLSQVWMLLVWILLMVVDDGCCG